MSGGIAARISLEQWYIWPGEVRASSQLVWLAFGHLFFLARFLQ